MKKRLMALLMALLMCFPASFAAAEEASSDAAKFNSFYKIPDTLTYKGGAVLRGFLKGADIYSKQLEVAYTTTSTPYLLLGEKTRWNVTISGGQAPYQCMVLVAYQQFGLDSFKNDWIGEARFELEGDSFTYTFNSEGKYFIEFRVMDDDGQFFTFQTRIYETYTQANESEPTTVAGKVNSIIASEITPGMSDYDRALVLHDWLIYHANYDYTYTNYDADGVLLKGTGVCDSYARAYLMLCTAAGLECIYVSGTAGSGAQSTWGDHGWNMVKIDGSWYHVDCTWDDPGEGGYERHDYFLLGDESLSADHRWNRPDDIFDPTGYLAPAAEKDYASNDAPDYDFTFTTMAEYGAGVDEMIASGLLKQKMTGLYLGTEDLNDFYNNVFWPWVTAGGTVTLKDAGRIAYAGFSGSLFYILPEWEDPAEYIDLAESEISMSVGRTATLRASDFYPAQDVFTWSSADPAIATVTGGYDENGPFATITAHASGTTAITATAPHGYASSATVTVMEAFAPDFALNMISNEGGFLLSWNAIPGVTEYTVVRTCEGKQTTLATTDAYEVQLTSAQLPADVRQEITVIGKRIVGGEAVFTYISDPIAYGKLTLTFEATLPDAVVAIDAEAFYGDTGLKSFKVPGNVQTIGDRAFYGCSALTTVCIPESVTSIGEGAFTGCPLQYAQVAQGSYAARYLLEYFPDIELVD